MTIDPRFRVEVIAATPNPQRTMYVAMHTDYAEGFVSDEPWPSEAKCGEICVNRLLKGDRGHWGIAEHPQITFNVGWFPHSVIQQGRTHRHTTWDVQSMRFSGERICDAALGKIHLEDVFYIRPAGHYTDRQGKRYEYTEEQRTIDRRLCRVAAERYLQMIEAGMAEEHARGILPFDYRQHFVVSFSLRALFHYVDLRWRMDAQLEIQQMCELMWPHVEAWVPEIAAWYRANRLHKGRLAP